MASASSAWCKCTIRSFRRTRSANRTYLRVTKRVKTILLNYDIVIRKNLKYPECQKHLKYPECQRCIHGEMRTGRRRLEFLQERALRPQYTLKTQSLEETGLQDTPNTQRFEVKTHSNAAFEGR